MVDLLEVKERANAAMPVPKATTIRMTAVYNTGPLRLDGAVEGSTNRKKITAGNRRAMDRGARTLWLVATSYGRAVPVDAVFVAVADEVVDADDDEGADELVGNVADAQVVMYVILTPAPFAFTPVCKEPSP